MALISCPECEAQVSSVATVCPSCGHPLRTAFVADLASGHYLGQSRSGLSLAALICGVSGLVLMFVPCLWFIAILPGLLGIVMASIALGRIKRGEAEGWGMAIGGLLCGIIGALLYLGMWVFFQGAMSQIFSD